jgi:leucyl/phenylalanyl-tRNA--protein transferase
VSGGCFIGDSMFSLKPNASKFALIHLAKHMQEHGGGLIDCQLRTKHLESMGGRYISYEKYMEVMRKPSNIVWDTDNQ